MLKSAVGIGSDKGVSIDAQIGDRANSANLGTSGVGRVEAEDNAIVNVNTTKNDAQIDQAENVIVNNGPSIWWAIIAIAGWILPTPASIFRLIPKFWRRKKDGK